ncbi:uncharacterized protein LOC114349380 isoform X1 [Diabrotica virgifera virgifera]|uniref:Mab-21-like HhH/H2TH-like domain-containing protein n=1 Tax=Diabrotica virgifera virgifera TaxID=50390 RepID=A0ABM5KS40_DIAVI|nr:uncharacterized protein LOC114349380 isoform X1 [Diabrotica virgifera virgifera]
MFNKKRSDSRKKSARFCRLDELVLPNSKLKFCPDQLQNLNYIINKRLQQNISTGTEKTLLLARSVSERLIQRLMCGAGMLDPRFSSKYLISNSQHKSNHLSNKLDYIIRLDTLSLPTLYEADNNPKYSITESESDYPAGYARIKLHTSTFKIWGDFTNSQGYLRRDKVQARLVELLAIAASKEVPSTPLHVDESVLCGIPGKVVDSYSLYSILKVPPDKHVYYGPGGNIPRFPDPRDFRLAIVDEPSGIRLKIEFLSPALSNITIDVTILVAVGIDSWPSSTDFPSRISLGHSDCLLYHQATQTGTFLVGFGVHSSAWQIRVPAAEQVILSHYGTNSTVRTVLDMMYLILDDIDRSRGTRKHQVSYKILSKYLLLTILLEDLECNSRNPITDMLSWAPLYLSTHLLRLLDKGVAKLLLEKQPNYFFRKSNLLVNPGHLSDDDYIIEANNLKLIMARFFDESLMSTRGNEDFNRIIQAQESEMILLYKWKDLVEGLLPPPGTRGRRFCFAGSKNQQEIAHTQYTVRQLEYIGMLLNKMLVVKQNILRVDHTVEDILNNQNYHHDHPLEDIIFILVTIMDQARDQYLSSQTNPAILKNRLKIKSNFNNHTSRLVDIMRKDKELISLVTFEDDLSLVKTILKWLYRGMDQSKRYLGPILRPYLNNIFASSHAISWHLESIKDRMSNDELAALGSFAELVNSGKITPAQGLIDSVNKNWSWAKNMLSMVQKNTLRVIYISERGRVYRHILSLPSYQRKNVESGSKTLEGPNDKKEIRRQKTLPNRSYFNSILNEKSEPEGEDIVPQHDHLKIASPLNYILNKKHRKGEHRGSGDIFKALAAMQKLSMFQEAALNLPAEERLEILELIQSIQTSKARRSAAKRWSGTIPQVHHKCKNLPKGESIQKYTPKEESAGIKVKEDTEKNGKEVVRKTSVLLESCRAARIKEDSVVFYLNDSFKIKSLLNKSDSFKY